MTIDKQALLKQLSAYGELDHERVEELCAAVHKLDGLWKDRDAASWPSVALAETRLLVMANPQLLPLLNTVHNIGLQWRDIVSLDLADEEE